jgi:hypothetical protein
MRTIAFIFAFFSTLTFFSQKGISGQYTFLGLKGTDIYISLTLKKDSTFDFVYMHNGTDENTGKWTVRKDTLILYSFRDNRPKIDTLTGEESIIGLKDSIEITFINKHKKTADPIDFSINNKCLNIRQPYTTYKIPKQEIFTISIPYKNEIYYVRNKKADKIVITYNPLRLVLGTQIFGYEKSVIKNDSLYQVECDGQLSKWPMVKK